MSKFEHSMRAFVRVAKCLSQVFGNEFRFISSSVQKVSPSANSLQEKSRSLSEVSGLGYQTKTYKEHS